MLKSYLAETQFLWPWAFALLGLLPLWWWLRRGRRPETTLRLAYIPPMLREPGWRVRLRWLPEALRALAWVMLVVALARPVRYQAITQTTGEGMEIMLCLDVSGSMLARDFQPNRLQAAVQVARDFVKRRRGDRIGLVIFAGQSFALCPLTTDHRALDMQLASIDYGMLADGTAIGSGLASSVDRLREGMASTRIVVLLTDGENTGGLIDPVTARELAKSFGIRVYTIGVGTEGFAPMPYQTPGGVTVMEKERVSIDEKLLKDIATQTGGAYYRATDSRSLETIYNTIDRLEKSSIETSVFQKRIEGFRPWLLAALILLALEWLLSYTVFRRFG